MKKTDEFDASRRTLLKNTMAVAAVGAVAATGLLSPRFAQAQGQASQATAMYQDQPHGQQQCDNCIHFIPGKTPQSMGTCKVVEGDISPSGWCVLYAAKQ